MIIKPTAAGFNTLPVDTLYDRWRQNHDTLLRRIAPGLPLFGLCGLDKEALDRIAAGGNEYAGIAVPHGIADEAQLFMLYDACRYADAKAEGREGRGGVGDIFVFNFQGQPASVFTSAHISESAASSTTLSLSKDQDTPAHKRYITQLLFPEHRARLAYRKVNSDFIATTAGATIGYVDLHRYHSGIEREDVEHLFAATILHQRFKNQEILERVLDVVERW